DGIALGEEHMHFGAEGIQGFEKQCHCRVALDIGIGIDHENSWCCHVGGHRGRRIHLIAALQSRVREGSPEQVTSSTGLLFLVVRDGPSRACLCPAPAGTSAPWTPFVSVLPYLFPTTPSCDPGRWRLISERASWKARASLPSRRSCSALQDRPPSDL